MYNLTLLVQGMLAMGFSVIGLFFLKYWCVSHDRLFGTFALAFFVFAAERITLAVIGVISPEAEHLFVLRLAGFILILVGIIDKNRSEGAGK